MANCSRERLLGEAIILVVCAIRTSLQTFRTFSDEWETMRPDWSIADFKIKDENPFYLQSVLDPSLAWPLCVSLNSSVVIHPYPPARSLGPGRRTCSHSCFSICGLSPTSLLHAQALCDHLQRTVLLNLEYQTGKLWKSVGACVSPHLYQRRWCHRSGAWSRFQDCCRNSPVDC